MEQEIYTTNVAQPAQPTQPAIVVQTTTVQKSSSFREAIPALPLPVAVLCCILNIFLPGIGTIVAGFSVLCCGNVGQSGQGRFGTFCVNFWVGILQLLLVVVFFIGWVWSIMWGVAFIASTATDSDKTTETTVTTVQQPSVGYVQTTIPQQTTVYS